MRTEIAHLQKLVTTTTDARVFEQIQRLIEALERRIRLLPDGRGTPL
jgi:hypothetical protein